METWLVFWQSEDANKFCILTDKGEAEKVFGKFIEEAQDSIGNKPEVKMLSDRVCEITSEYERRAVVVMSKVPVGAKFSLEDLTD